MWVDNESVHLGSYMARMRREVPFRYLRKWDSAITVCHLLGRVNIELRADHPASG